MCVAYQLPLAAFHSEESRNPEPTFKGTAFANCEPGLAKHAQHSSVCSLLCLHSLVCHRAPHLTQHRPVLPPQELFSKIPICETIFLQFQAHFQHIVS